MARHSHTHKLLITTLFLLQQACFELQSKLRMKLATHEGRLRGALGVEFSLLFDEILEETDFV